jgi:hypothetical protein
MHIINIEERERERERSGSALTLHDRGPPQLSTYSGNMSVFGLEK